MISEASSLFRTVKVVLMDRHYQWPEATNRGYQNTVANYAGAFLVGSGKLRGNHPLGEQPEQQCGVSGVA